MDWGPRIMGVLSKLNIPVVTLPMVSTHMLHFLISLGFYFILTTLMVSPLRAHAVSPSGDTAPPPYLTLVPNPNLKG